MDFNSPKGKSRHSLSGDNFTWSIELNRDLYWCYQNSCKDSFTGYKKRLYDNWVEIHPELRYLSIDQLCRQVRFIEEKRMSDFNNNNNNNNNNNVQNRYQNGGSNNTAGKTKYDLVKENSRQNHNEWVFPAHYGEENMKNAWNVLPGQHTAYQSNRFYTTSEFQSGNDGNLYSRTQVYSNSSAIPSHDQRNVEFIQSSYVDNQGITENTNKAIESGISSNEQTVQIDGTLNTNTPAEQITEGNMELTSVEVSNTTETDINQSALYALSSNVKSNYEQTAQYDESSSTNTPEEHVADDNIELTNVEVKDGTTETKDTEYDSEESVGDGTTVHNLRSRKINVKSVVVDGDSSEGEEDDNNNNDGSGSEYEIEEEEEEEEIDSDADDDDDPDYVVGSTTTTGRNASRRGRKARTKKSAKTRRSAKSEVDKILEYKTDEEEDEGDEEDEGNEENEGNEEDEKDEVLSDSIGVAVNEGDARTSGADEIIVEDDSSEDEEIDDGREGNEVGDEGGIEIGNDGKIEVDDGEDSEVDDVDDVEENEIVGDDDGEEIADDVVEVVDDGEEIVDVSDGEVDGVEEENVVEMDNGNEDEDEEDEEEEDLVHDNDSLDYAPPDLTVRAAESFSTEGRNTSSSELVVSATTDCTSADADQRENSQLPIEGGVSTVISVSDSPIDQADFTLADSNNINMLSTDVEGKSSDFIEIVERQNVALQNVASQNVESQNVVSQNVDLSQNVESQSVASQNIESQNVASQNVELSQTLSIVVQNVTEDELKDVDVINRSETLLAPIIVLAEEENDEELVRINLNKRKYEQEGGEQTDDLPCMSSRPPDKMIKLDTKDDLREELQKILTQEEKNMVTLTEKIEKASIAFGKDVEEIEEEEEEKLVYDMEGKVIEKETIVDSDENVEIDETKSIEEIGEVEGEKQNGEMEVEEDPKSEPVPTPCITRKSLRQRNRGSHTPTPPPAQTADFKVEEKASVEKNTVSEEPKEKPTVAKDLFNDLTMAIKMLEGHYQDVCAVDLNGEHIVSAGRDTSVKLWTTSSKEELKSVGGHTATITGVKFMKDKQYATYPNAISGSYDCSVRVWDLENGTETKCIYVYSPVVCLDYLDGRVAIGTEGGKVEVYNVESGDQLFSMKSHDEAVSAVKLLAGDKVACGSTDGVLKIFNISITQLEPVFVLDPLKVSIKQACETTATESQGKSTLAMSKITCITSWKDLVIYGDEGFNLKVLDYEKGEVVKVRNNLQEFCPTESLHVTSVQGTDCLFSVGSDVDRGDAYINVRSLPDLKYFGTIRDNDVSTGSITTFCAEEIDNCIRLVTGGQQLRVWDQAPRRAKKRKSAATTDESLIPCKFICNYTEARESEPESETDESSSASRTGTGSSTEVSLQSPDTQQRWCSIL